MEAAKKKKLIERIVILVFAAMVIFLLVFFLKDKFIPFIRAEINGDKDAAAAVLNGDTWFDKWSGFATVSLVEGLQMVVIFIPAEFIQISSGMAYPWWLAMLLCDIGVVIGSSIIYLLVNLFKFNGDIMNKGSSIAKMEKRSRVSNHIVLMYLLFIMPIIPFGAICYYSASKKIPYHKYVFACATGVIPSIATSYLMGFGINSFIAYGLPLWALILIIFGAGTVLFILLFFVIKKFFLKQDVNTPNSIFYSWIIRASRIVHMWKNRFRWQGKEKLDAIDGPFVLLCNHHSQIDPFAILSAEKERRYSFVMNRYYLGVPVFGKMLKKAGFIPKKMFFNDLPCVAKITKAVKDDYPIVIYPEARLSIDGGPSYFDDSTAKLVTFLKVPVALMQIRGAYTNHPKWRKKAYRGKVILDVKEVISPEEIEKLGVEGLHERFQSVLCFNEFDNPVNIYNKKKDMAVGLEKALYMCPHCGELFTNVSEGNEIKCSHCGKTYHIGPDYKFIEDEEIKTITDYYGKIKETELKNIDNVNLDIEVDVTIFDKNVRSKRSEKGVIHFDKDVISFKSTQSDLAFSYENAKLEGIAYSVNEEFELYYQDELYYFYPTNMDRAVCTRIALLHELLKARADGRVK